MKPEAIISIYEVICKRCNYIWSPRNPDIKPKACPQCKRYDWDVKVSSAQSMGEPKQAKRVVDEQ